MFGREVVVVVGRGVIGDVVIVAVDVASTCDSPDAVDVSRLCQTTQHLPIRVRHGQRPEPIVFFLGSSSVVQTEQPGCVCGECPVSVRTRLPVCRRNEVSNKPVSWYCCCCCSWFCRSRYCCGPCLEDDGVTSETVFFFHLVSETVLQGVLRICPQRKTRAACAVYGVAGFYSTGGWSERPQR